MFPLSFLQFSPTAFPRLGTSCSILEAHLYRITDAVSFEKMVVGQESSSIGMWEASAGQSVARKILFSFPTFFLKVREFHSLLRICRTEFEAIFETMNAIRRRVEKTNNGPQELIQTQTLAESLLNPLQNSTSKQEALNAIYQGQMNMSVFASTRNFHISDYNSVYVGWKHIDFNARRFTVFNFQHPNSEWLICMCHTE